MGLKIYVACKCHTAIQRASAKMSQNTCWELVLFLLSTPMPQQSSPPIGLAHIILRPYLTSSLSTVVDRDHWGDKNKQTINPNEEIKARCGGQKSKHQDLGLLKFGQSLQPRLCRIIRSFVHKGKRGQNLVMRITRAIRFEKRINIAVALDFESSSSKRSTT